MVYALSREDNQIPNLSNLTAEISLINKKESVILSGFTIKTGLDICIFHSPESSVL